MVVSTKYGTYPDSFAKFVRPTALADYDHGYVKKQANLLKEEADTPYQAIKAAHELVAAMPMGYDREDSKASYILQQGRGQCNTKTTLIVALLRGMGVPARVHAWRVDKQVHEHHMPRLVYWFTPRTTLFTYPEVYYKDEWQLLSQALYSNKNPEWDACPFDDAEGREHPLKDEWIAEDLGVYWHPDDVYAEHGTNADGWRRLAFPIAQALLNK